MVAGNCEKDENKYNDPNDIIKCDCITGGPAYQASCKVKSGVTDYCQQTIKDAWIVENPTDAGKQNILSLVTVEFMKEKCEAQSESCVMSPTMEGVCVSIGITLCPDKIETECVKQPDFCEWK